MDILDKVPDEVWQQILSNFVCDRETLRAVVDAKFPASPQALRLYWRNDVCDKDLLEELEDEPESEQQDLANMVRNVITQFKGPYAHHEARGLQFPRLQILKIEHGKAQLRGETRTFVRVGRFVGPRLRQLEIGVSLLEGGSHLVPTVDSFLQKLSVCKDLRDLKLYARVKKATAEDLVFVLQRCNKIQTLHLGGIVDDLINESVMGCIALHPTVGELVLEKHFDRPLASSIAAVAQPFQKLKHLVLSAHADAINILLPRMKQLERLELAVYGTTSVFPSLRGLKNSSSIWLKFHNYTLTNDDVSHLVPLKQLAYIELCETNDAELLDATLIDANLFAAVLGTLPALVSLDLNATNTLGDPFPLALGHQCRNLRYLALTSNFTLEPLATEPSVLFPHLLSLELGSFTPSVPIRQWGGFESSGLISALRMF